MVIQEQQVRDVVSTVAAASVASAAPPAYTNLNIEPAIGAGKV